MLKGKKLYNCINDIANNVPLEYWTQPDVIYYVTSCCENHTIAKSKVQTRFHNLLNDRIRNHARKVRAGDRSAYDRRARYDYVTTIAPKINLRNPGKAFKKIFISYDDGTTAEGRTGIISVNNLSSIGVYNVISSTERIVKNMLSIAWNLDDPYSDNHRESWSERSMELGDYKYVFMKSKLGSWVKPFRDSSVLDNWNTRTNGGYSELSVRRLNKLILNMHRVSTYSSIREAVDVSCGGLECKICLAPDIISEFIEKINTGVIAEEVSSVENKILDIINSHS